MAGAIVLGLLVLVCLGSLPWTLASPGVSADGQALPARYKLGDLDGFLLPPFWVGLDERERERRDAVARNRAIEIARASDPALSDAEEIEVSEEDIEANRPAFVFGSDKLGRSLFVRCMTGGGVSIGIGIAAAAISVVIGTLYGTIAGYAGGRLDSAMMRVVDILYGLPYLLLVVLLAVAGDAMIDRYAINLALDSQSARKTWMLSESAGSGPIEVDPATLSEPLRAAALAYLESAARTPTDAANLVREARRAIDAGAIQGFEPVDVVIDAQLGFDAAVRAALEARATSNADLPSGELSAGKRTFLEVLILLLAIGGLSWLTMARVIRGQVLSLKAQPFMEAARATGVPLRRQFFRHLLPNLLGPIIVYATLTVPQAILQESFLSFLGIGVRPPLPSWGNLAADGLIELNTVHVRWWLLLFPSILLGITLLALNFVGEGLREAFDPRRAR